MQVDPAESLMREVGAQLRQRRLERGEDLDDVAKSLRIKPSYLLGIEQGDLTALPGRPYALGFLRSYADYLGFDGDDLVDRIKAAVADLTDRTRLRIRMPLPENRLPKAPVVVISLAVVVGVYAGWSYINRSSRMAVDTVAEVPNDLRERAIEASPRNPDVEAPVAGAAAPGRVGGRRRIRTAVELGRNGAGGSQRCGPGAGRSVAPHAGPPGQATDGAGAEWRPGCPRGATRGRSWRCRAGPGGGSGRRRGGAAPSAERRGRSGASGCRRRPGCFRGRAHRHGGSGAPGPERRRPAGSAGLRAGQ